MMKRGAGVILYSREGCHLCEEVRAQIDKLRGEYGFTLEVVDVEGDADLRASYGEHVPVVTVDGVEALRHRWSPQGFLTALRGPSEV